MTAVTTKHTFILFFVYSFWYKNAFKSQNCGCCFPYCLVRPMYVAHVLIRRVFVLNLIALVNVQKIIMWLQERQTHNFSIYLLTHTNRSTYDYINYDSLSLSIELPLFWAVYFTHQTFIYNLIFFLFSFECLFADIQPKAQNNRQESTIFHANTEWKLFPQKEKKILYAYKAIHRIKLHGNKSRLNDAWWTMETKKKEKE